MTYVTSYNPNIFEISSTVANNRWENIIEEAARDFGVPAELLNQMMRFESSGNPFAVGDGGMSHGLMQIQQGTWEDFKKNYGDKLPPDLRNASYEQIVNDPEMNMRAAAAMMKAFHDKWMDKGYSSDDAWKLALREYNSGSYAVNPDNLWDAGPGTPAYVDKIWSAFSTSPNYETNTVPPADEWDIG